MSGWREFGRRAQPTCSIRMRSARFIVCSTAGVVAWFRASLALGAGGGHGVNLHPEINWWSWDMEAPPIGWFLINFILFIAVLIRFAGPALNRIFAARSSKIRDAIEVNEREFEHAQAERQKWQEKVASIDDEIRDLVSNCRRDGEAEKTKIIDNAQGYVARMRSDAQLIVEQEARGAERVLQLEISRQALDSAESLLRETITDADRKRLFENAVAELAQGGPSLEPDRPARVGSQGGR